jgi:hypothetical protein
MREGKDEARQGFCGLRLRGLIAGAQEGPVPPCESPTTKLYDRRSDEITLDEVERIAI